MRCIEARGRRGRGMRHVTVFFVFFVSRLSRTISYYRYMYLLQHEMDSYDVLRTCVLRAAHLGKCTYNII